MNLCLLLLVITASYAVDPTATNHTKFIPCPEVADWYECPDGIVDEGFEVDRSHAQARAELEQAKNRKSHHRVRGEH